jgi:predicted permease
VTTGWLQDLRYAFRALGRHPLSVAAALLTLVLGVGASAAVWAVVDAVLLHPLPYPRPDRLVDLHEHPAGAPDVVLSVSVPAFRDWERRNRVFSALGAHRRDGMVLTGAGEPAHVATAMVSGGFFDVFGVPPLLGRALAASDDRASASPAAVLSAGLWRRRFDGDPTIVGRSVLLDGREFAVAGVMPAGFAFPAADVDAWVPLALFRDRLPVDDRGSHPRLWVAGRLRDGVDLSAARADMARVSASIEDETGFASGVLAQPLAERVLAPYRGGLHVMLGAVALVMALACANVALLQLTRALARRHELSVRAALGGSRRHLARLVLTESLLIALLGGAGGLLAAVWGVDLLVARLPAAMPRLDGVAVGSGVWRVAAALALLSALWMSVPPLLQLAHGPATDAAGLAGRSAACRAGRGRLRGALVALEVALALVLLVGAALLLRSLAGPRLQLLVFGAFAAVALVLAAVGIYGVVSHAVEQSTAEIGVRMALGARRTQIVARFVGRGAVPIACGVAAGLAGAAALARLLAGLLYGVAPLDPLAWAGVAMLLVPVGLVACVVPASRAAALDPTTALRSE